MEFKLNLPSTSKKLMIEMINPVIGNLTTKEIELLSTIIDMKISVLDKDSRTDVRMKLDMDKFNFNNYIKKLREKKVLQQVDKLTLKVNPNLVHILKHDSININFV